MHSELCYSDLQAECSSIWSQNNALDAVAVVECLTSKPS